jgi:iron-sulfur cluster repair protein YtfE (RIC family)
VSITKQLREDHAELEVMVQSFHEMLDRRDAADRIELVEFRQKFSRAILAHLHREDSWLYPELLKSDQQYVATMAQAFIHEMGGLLDAYKQWSLSWPTQRALDNWELFGVETRGILDALVMRIENENLKLYPLLEQGPTRAMAS